MRYAILSAIICAGCGQLAVKLDNPPVIVEAGAVQAPVTVTFPDDLVDRLISEAIPNIMQSIPPIVVNVPVQVGKSSGTTIGDALISGWPYLAGGGTLISVLTYLIGHYWTKK